MFQRPFQQHIISSGWGRVVHDLANGDHSCILNHPNHVTSMACFRLPCSASPWRPNLPGACNWMWASSSQRRFPKSPNSITKP